MSNRYTSKKAELNDLDEIMLGFGQFLSEDAITMLHTSLGSPSLLTTILAAYDLIEPPSLRLLLNEAIEDAKIGMESGTLAKLVEEGRTEEVVVLMEGRLERCGKRGDAKGIEGILEDCSGLAGLAKVRKNGKKLLKKTIEENVKKAEEEKKEKARKEAEEKIRKKKEEEEKVEAKILEEKKKKEEEEVNRSPAPLAVKDGKDRRGRTRTGSNNSKKSVASSKNGDDDDVEGEEDGSSSSSSEEEEEANDDEKEKTTTNTTNTTPTTNATTTTTATTTAQPIRVPSHHGTTLPPPPNINMQYQTYPSSTQYIVTSSPQSPQQISLHTSTLPLPPGLVGWVIGRSGTRIKSIMKNTNTMLWIDQDVGDEEDRVLYIKGGSLEAVEAAKKEVLRLVRKGGGLTEEGEGEEEEGGENEKTFTKILPCPPHLVGLLIGYRGSTIRHINESCNVRGERARP